MNITKIYLVTNCYNNPFKVYIGKTKNNREQSHKLKFGKDIIYSYIDEVNSLNHEDWKPLESFWINYFKMLGFDVQNKNNGGGGPCFHTEQSKKLLSYILKGKTKPPRTKDHSLKLSEANKGLKKPNSGKIKGVPLTEKEIVFRRKKRKKQSLETINKRVEKNKGQKRNEITKNKMSLKKLGKPSNNFKFVFQYDLNNNFIKRWDRVTDASNYLNIRRHGIILCALNKTKTYKNFIWKYY